MLDITNATVHPVGTNLIAKVIPRTALLLPGNSNSQSAQDFKVVAVGPDVKPPIVVGAYVVPTRAVGLDTYDKSLSDLRVIDSVTDVVCVFTGPEI